MTTHRRIGGLDVSAIGLGCMGMSMAYHGADQAGSIATIHHALDIGLNLFDTADMYGAGRNEQLVGRALKGRRDHAVIATKFGFRTIPPGIPVGLSGRPEYARRCLNNSLRRLGVDHIDLYYLHRPDPRVPIEETVGAMAEAVAAGTVRELGLSEVTAEQLRRAHAVHPIAALQSEWSLFSRDLETEVLPAARELGVAIVPYSPLGRGMLTGSAEGTTRLGFLDFRRFLPRWRKANLAHNLGLVDQIRSIADDLGATPAQVALAWVLHRGPDVVPIPGTTKIRHLESNLAALSLSLPDDARDALNGLRPAGARYPGGSSINGTT